MANAACRRVTRHSLGAGHFVDARGWVVNPIPPPYAARPFGHLHLASMAPGAVRGNHRHRRLNELIFVWGGRSAWRVEGPDGGEEFELSAAELTVVEIPAGLGHAVRNIDDHLIYLLSYYDQPYDAAHPDVEPCHLLGGSPP